MSVGCVPCLRGRKEKESDWSVRVSNGQSQAKLQVNRLLSNLHNIVNGCQTTALPRICTGKDESKPKPFCQQGELGSRWEGLIVGYVSGGGLTWAELTIAFFCLAFHTGSAWFFLFVTEWCWFISPCASKGTERVRVGASLNREVRITVSGSTQLTGDKHSRWNWNRGFICYVEWVFAV